MPLRIFDRYIWRQVSSSTLTGVLVLTGVMVLGNVFKEMERLLGDTASLPLMAVAQFITYVIPYSLIFTIPWALLTAILLVFGRMSADNEMTALRMTGMSMPRICAAVFVLSVFMSGVCYLVNVELAPLAKTKIKRLFYDLALDDPAVLFQPGKVLDRFPGYRIFTQEREGNKLKNVEIIQTNLGRAERYIRAKRAEVVVTPGVTDFQLHLRNATVETGGGEADAASAGAEVNIMNDLQFLYMGDTAITFPLSKLKEKTERVTSSMKDTSALWSEVNTGISSVDGQPLSEKLISVSRTELSMRYSFSLAAIVFTLVGIPLGITAQRRETSIGFALSLIVAVSYMVFVIFVNGLNERPSVYPHLLMWVPNLIFIGVGSRMFYKLNRR
ncbi:LptF/LptG family permease [Verrucomicrobium sp. BvORR034]|jgi:lipopolysaccharide export LptBFGC system permease protein LptF|uniref:LptF/LptG family permease n=1 Tax=Verrucomicrobium sp. BvORR034 TaxID=1396418 RepID=UPI000678A74C|nr:LptF/LptG family permease [Verrucomicrobium sp. BvORR034]